MAPARHWPGHIPRAINKDLRDRARGTVLQRNDSVGPACCRVDLTGEYPQFRMLRQKLERRCQKHGDKASGRQEADPHVRAIGNHGKSRSIQSRQFFRTDDIRLVEKSLKSSARAFYSLVFRPAFLIRAISVSSIISRLRESAQLPFNLANSVGIKLSSVNLASKISDILSFNSMAVNGLKIIAFARQWRLQPYEICTADRLHFYVADNERKGPSY
jgi:hypothetical protein